MKKLFLSLILTLLSLSGMAQTIGEAFYIYRNDGEINGFVRSDIDSIAYSFYDADSVLYSDIVTQVIYTVDSVFSIPLAVIDSISFVTPKTTYQPGVINLSDELMPYILSCDSMTLSFSNSISMDRLPNVGDKLVTTEMNEIFPIGFAGEVTSVDKFVVECKRVALEDVFETYYHVASVYGYIETDENAQSRKVPYINPVDTTADLNFKVHTITIPYNTEISRAVKPNSDLALNGGSGMSVEITPSFHIHAMLIMNREEGTYFQARVSGNLNVKEIMTIYGGIQWSHDFANVPILKSLKVERPVCPYVTFFFEPGLFLRANATISASLVAEQNYTFAWTRDWSTKGKNIIKPSSGGRLVGYGLDVEGCFDGSLAAGLYTELGLSLLHSELDNVSLCGEVGGEFVSHAVLYNSDIDAAEQGTGVYERFKQSNFAVNAFVNTSVNLELVGGIWGTSYPLPWNLSYNIRSWDIVPTFSNTMFKQCLEPRTSADASVDMTGDCLIPVSVGFSVRDQNMREVDDVYAQNKFDNGNKPLSYTFKNISDGGDYTLYPKVRILGHDFLANPSAPINKKEFPVEITAFEQIGSQYDKNGFSYNGVTYSYKYDCAVTVNLKETEDIEDWGYVYIDPNEDETYISLKSFQTPYRDTHYVCYRNESNSTVTLCPYVKMKDGNKVKGVEKIYDVSHSEVSCPDSNHPHLIDLGLPSGNQWYCCNIVKHGVYNEINAPNTYNGFMSQEIFQNLCQQDTVFLWPKDFDYYSNLYSGNDSLFNNYMKDVSVYASFIPSVEDYMELMNYCQFQRTENGWIFTGPNNNKLLFPSETSATSEIGLYGTNSINEVFAFYYRPSGEGGYGIWHINDYTNDDFSKRMRDIFGIPYNNSATIVAIRTLWNSERKDR